MTKEAVIRLALVLGSLALTGLLIEVGLQAFGSETPVVYVTTLGREKVQNPLPGVRYLYPARASYSQVWPDNPRGYFDPDTHGLRYRVNNYGFRGTDFSLARSGAVRIALLGDSFCWGLGVRDEDTFAVRIEQKLNAEAPLGQAYEVYNFCLPGYGTEHEAALYDHVVRHFQPDLLVVWYFLNDVNRPPDLYVQWLTGRHDRRSRSRLLDLLLERINRRRAFRELVEGVDRAYAEGHPGLNGVRAGLRRIRGLSAAEGVPAFLAILPWLYRLEAYPFDQPHQVVARLAEGGGFAVLDLLSVFGGQRARDLWVHPLDHHPNETGHAMIAEAMHDALASHLGQSGEQVVAAAERRRLTPPLPRLDAAPGRDWYSPFVELATSPAEGDPPSSSTEGLQEDVGDHLVAAGGEVRVER